ncbi:MAG: hypothetical protein JRE47_04035 [Deltaproteobacteria bacterium]|nr:hypothetical protein [Deltaproteobacteria bacterium]
MAQDNKISIITMTVIVIVIAFVLQVVFVFADNKDAPYRAVVDFSKAYFWLDKSMDKRLCDAQRTINGVNVVDEYIRRVTSNAKENGWSLNYMKSIIYHIETHTLSKNDSNAVVRLTCYKKKAINPLFPIVAKIFRLNKTSHIDETINVIKEDGKWKVCGNLFDLTEQSKI